MLALCPPPLYHLGMNPSPIDVFGLAEKRLAWIGQRQSVLAQNIANANTPGYAAQDVTPFRDVLAQMERQTESGGSSQSAASVAKKTVEAKSLNGNAVVMDEQLEKVAESDTAHQLASNLYKKYVNLFKVAIGRA